VVSISTIFPSVTRTYTFVFDPDPEGGFARRGKLSKPLRSFSPALALQRDALAEAGCSGFSSSKCRAQLRIDQP
jgi:hypothetical protein